MPTHYRGSPKEIRALDAYIKLTRAAESLNARLGQRGTHRQLTPSQFGVLETLLHLGPMCQTDISNRLLKSTGNITLVIDNLEKRGLVRRERDAVDRRYLTVYLTDAGTTLIVKTFADVEAAIVAEMAVLEPQEQELLGTLCNKLGLKGGGSKPVA